VPKLTAQRFARSIELAPLAAHAPGPRVLAQRVDHGAPHAPLCESFEFDAAIFVKTVRCIDQSDHAVLNQITDIDRVGHRRCHSSRERFDKGKAGDDPAGLTGRNRLNTHLMSPQGWAGWAHPPHLPSDAHHRNGGTNGRACVPLHDPRVLRLSTSH
jgi:hypothetical protein